MRSGAEHCIPPSVTVAQGVLESGWGRSTNAVEHNNLFGIKAHRGEPSATAATWEYVGGRKVRQKERFRNFSSWLDAVRQHDRRLAEHPAYEEARTVRTSAPAFIEALAPVYATDPAYEERLLALIERYGLEALDPPTLARAEAREGMAGDPELHESGSVGAGVGEEARHLDVGVEPTVVGPCRDIGEDALGPAPHRISPGAGETGQGGLVPLVPREPAVGKPHGMVPFLHGTRRVLDPRRPAGHRGRDGVGQELLLIGRGSTRIVHGAGWNGRATAGGPGRRWRRRPS